MLFILSLFQHLEFIGEKDQKKMFVDSLVYTIPSGSPRTSTNTASTFMLTSRTSQFLFRSMKDIIVDSTVNYQLALAKRLSRKFSKGKENAALENFILSETLKCIDDLNKTYFF